MGFQALTIATDDGVALAARAYEPDGRDGPPRRAVLISPAMGVGQRFYEAFATWLAGQGVAVLTFDFRGMGDSAPARLRGFKASITTWATQDQPAVVRELVRRWPGVPYSYLGHSLGGQIFGMLDGHTHFDRMLTVASGNGHVALNAPQVRRTAPLLWWVLAPVGIAVAGYFPGKRLGAVGDMPAGAMWQWRRWCLHPEYLGSEGAHMRERYAQVRTPIRAVILEDDELVSPEGIRRLYKLYSQAPVQFESLTPKALGLKRIGHFGVFQSHAKTVLWPRVLHWLEA